MAYCFADFLIKVIRRDGYRCILTGVQDVLRPNRVKGTCAVRLVVAHILHRALGRFDDDHNSDSVRHLLIQGREFADPGSSFFFIQYKSAVTTFDILRNFTRLSAQTLEQLTAELDNPLNGMTLQSDAHDAFDEFDWCLRKTEVSFIPQFNPIHLTVHPD